MISPRLLSRHDVARVLGPYKCEQIGLNEAGFEMWRTGWGEAFTLAPEQDGIFDEWQVRRVIATVIASTIPPDWFPNGVATSIANDR